MEKTLQDFAVAAIDDPKKIRVLLHGGTRRLHAPLPALLAVRKGVGWVEYADGTLVQWGYVGSRTDGVDPMITFERPFAHLCRHVSVNVAGDYPPGFLIAYAATDINTVSFVARGRFIGFNGGGGLAGQPFSWMAWGN